MGQAKNRKAEIDALKAMGLKTAPTIKGYMPDAGLNSDEGINHYWFQVAELIQTMSQAPMRGYTKDGVNYIEISMPVDIMNHAGDQHLSPQTDKGYYATFRFTADRLEQFAQAIDKGGMSVRVAGIPAETDTTIHGERFRVIDACDVWSEGNAGGYMAYMVMSGTKMIQTNSRHVAKRFAEIAQQVRDA